MEFNFVEFVLSWLPTVLTIGAVVLVYIVTQKLLSRQTIGKSDRSLIRTLLLFTIVVVGFLFVILAAPIPQEIKSNLTSLFGIVISAALALSSATFLGNALAGIMMKFINSYKVGDFISVGEVFGRVTEKGLFHTEVQRENRDLVTIPNLQLANNPVNVIRASGTFITATCSLGFDVNHILIKEALIKATQNAGLEDGFVQVIELGDFSVVYKVFGFLKDAKTVVSSKSKLHTCMLDALHDANIEIVSPNFMNQRQVGDTVFIPKKTRKKIEEIDESTVEEKMFDKAQDAESLQKSKENLNTINQKMKELADALKQAETDEEKAKIQAKIDQCERIKSKMTQSFENKLDDFEAKE